jgi:predicted HTH domain antitoxin
LPTEKQALEEKTLQLYKEEKLTMRKAAEMLGITLREFMELLEKRGIPENYDSEVLKEFMKSKMDETAPAAQQ